ncbi:MAG: LPS export ABC transporter periplasmic protein LptC [Bacteroidales bacterium]|nr:LPS export ABC transporter periplasmic protein LptC [Bacteroidales bacterium]MCF8390842.1 LPS export ABC transporter periplasmic protein LptC [Bacteroidales bacterium]
MFFLIKNTFSILKRLLVLSGVFLLLFSCENDIQKINSLTESEILPTVSGEGIEIVYTDSSRLDMILRAKKIKQFTKTERPYIEFPDGIYVEFYDDSIKIEATLKADYALYYNEENLWEARGNVQAHNIVKNENLNTEELFWNEDKKLIYSNSFSRIETDDGIFYGQDGFESNQKFTKWKLKGSKGTVNIKSEADEKE